MKRLLLYIFVISPTLIMGQANLRSLSVTYNLLSVTGVIPYGQPIPPSLYSCTSPTNPIGYNTSSSYLNYTLDVSSNNYKVDLDGDALFDVEFDANYKSKGLPTYINQDGILSEHGSFDYDIKITGNQPLKKIAFMDASVFPGGNYISIYDTSLFKGQYRYHIEVDRHLDCVPPYQSSVTYEPILSPNSNINFLNFTYSSGMVKVLPFYFQNGDNIYFGKMVYYNGTSGPTPTPQIYIQRIPFLPCYLPEGDNTNNGDFLTNSFDPFNYNFTGVNFQNFRMVIGKLVNGNCDWVSSSSKVSIPYWYDLTSCNPPHPQLFSTPICTSQVKQDLFVMLLPKTTTSVNLSSIKYKQFQSCSGFYYTLSFCNNSNVVIPIDTSKAIYCLDPLPIKYALSNGISVAITTTPKRSCLSNYTNVVVNTPQSGQVAKITYPHEVIPISSIPPWNKKTGDTLFYSSIVPNSIFKIQILDSVSCTSNLPVGSSNSIKAQLYLPSTTSITSDLRISGQCVDSIYKVIIVNKGSPMKDSAKYYIYENGLLAFSEKLKLNANDTFKFDVKAAGNCILVRVDEESNNVKESYEMAEIEGCGGYKEIGKNRFVYRPIQRLVGYATYVINNSNDPNSKEVIPSGVGTDNQVLLNTPLTYTLNFQNTGNDTAYAVKILDSLSVNLNPKTLKVLYATHNYTTSTSGSTFLFDFPGIKLVDSVHNEKLSHGYIKFQINPISGLTNGSIVKNKASIYFDNNSPVVTNEVLTTYVNKLDTLVDSSIVKIYTKIVLNKDTIIYKYGDSARNIGFKANVSKLQVTNSVVDTSISFFSSSGNLKPKNVGTSFFTLSSMGTYKYYPASTQGTVTVIKAGLSVIADSLQKLSNTPNPNFKFHFKGFKNGDSANVISGNPQFATTADSTSPVGNYPITISSGTLSSRNYDFSFVNGNLRVVLNCTKFQNSSIQPSMVSVCPNIPVTFTTTTDGLVSYSWSDGSNSSYLTTTSPGIYSVTISGACGTKTPSPATLAILPQTNITNQPVSTTACIDSSAAFTVVAIGSGLNYQWSEGTNTPTFTTSIPGFYTVTVSGTCGTAVSNTVQLSSTNTCAGTVTTLNNNTETPTLQIFPNPTNGIITINSPEPGDYKIMDGIGTVVKKGALNQGKNTISLELPQGVYYLLSNWVVIKLVVEQL